MKSTKYLFDEIKQTPEGMVSVSQLQTFMSCPKKWEYGYIENLTPRVERPYLGIGKLCHRGMEKAMLYKWKLPVSSFEQQLTIGQDAMRHEWEEYMNSNCFLEEEISDQEQILYDALSVFEQAFAEFEPWKYEVVELVKNKTRIPALELHFVVPCPGSKGLHGYIDAILKDKETGYTWCVDYKFRKTLSPDEDEISNIQNAVYVYACNKMGVDVTGTMTWQHLNTPASEPQLLKNGAVSRAKIKTTWEKYAQFCVEHNVDPSQYEGEMREKLADIEWFRPTLEYRNEETIKNMWKQVVIPASWLIRKAQNPQNRKSRFLYPWNCKMCQFKNLCQAELRNHDAKFVRETEFKTRSKN